VFAREFGAPVIRASPAVGLVEGLAVALEPPAGYPAPAEQVAAARALSPAAAGRLSAGPAAAVTTSMSALGFWTGRGAVSYVTSGAFVGWLLERYGADALRRAYASGRFTSAYGRGIEALAEEWAGEIARVPVTPEARALAEWRFSQPSLLEVRCPHHVPRERRLTRRAGRAWADGDLSGALALYERALEHSPTHVPALVGWASAALSAGAPPADVVRRIAAAAADTLDSDLLLVEGDARLMDGDREGAHRAYDAAAGLLPPFAREAREHVALRRALPEAAVPWLHARDPAHAAAALEALAPVEPAAAFFSAARWLEAGAPGRALSVLSRTPAPSRPAAAAARLAALGHLARMSGRPADAARYAAAAARSWRAAGSTALARQQDDRADEARWVALLSGPPRER
jgi:hypothetical protein